MRVPLVGYRIGRSFRSAEAPLEKAIDLLIGCLSWGVAFTSRQGDALLIAQQFVHGNGVVERRPAFGEIGSAARDQERARCHQGVEFDQIVAAPLGLERVQSHAGDFVAKLENAQEVFERSKRVFAPGREPLVDTETLIFDSDKHCGRFGKIEFQKIATQIADNNAELAAWIVYLNVSRAERWQELWRDVTTRLKEALHWARYALSYDKLLLNFDDYDQLVSSIVKRLGSCRRCVDLGAGTGNGTLKLLQARPDREVWAVEASHAMLQCLIDKVTRAETDAECDYFKRLRPFREDILRLDQINVLPTGYFDGAALINVLYTLDDPERCLREVHELLRPGGVLVLSTPHSETDVDQLFDQMAKVLTRKGLFPRLQSNYDDARRRHEEMMDSIHRDTKDDIRGYLQRAGFIIRDWRSAYVDAVVIVEAVRDG